MKKHLNELSLEELRQLSEDVFFQLTSEKKDWEECVEQLFEPYETLGLIRDTFTDEDSILTYSGFLEDINSMAVNTVEHVCAKILWLSVVIETLLEKPGRGDDIEIVGSGTNYPTGYSITDGYFNG